jgi:catechol 2,3-dioxygenase-like lactoylglutathione lyase family enzyme
LLDVVSSYERSTNVECKQHHPSLFVTDIAAAVAYYTDKLGFSLNFTWGDPPSMAGVTLGKVQIFLERGTPSPAALAVTSPPARSTR